MTNAEMADKVGAIAARWIKGPAIVGSGDTARDTLARWRSDIGDAARELLHTPGAVAEVGVILGPILRDVER